MSFELDATSDVTTSMCEMRLLRHRWLFRAMASGGAINMRWREASVKRGGTDVPGHQTTVSSVSALSFGSDFVAFRFYN